MNDTDAQSLTVIVPAHNEEQCLVELVTRLATTLSPLDLVWDVLVVDDGSTDATWQVTRELRKKGYPVGGIRLSRNFGKEIAMSAGIDHVDGACVIIDADLQDPPELITEMVRIWREEAVDVVYAQRRVRVGESTMKRTTAHLFYRVINRLSRTPIPRDTGDFRLMSPRAVRALQRIGERNRFMKGLFAWIGYRQRALLYDRDARQGGTTKFNYWKLWNFAVDGITSFSAAPLRLATLIGLLASVLAMLYAAFVVVKTLIFGDPVQGYPSLMVVILFLGGMQLLALGVIGEYLGRLFDETKGRPLYLVEDTIDKGGRSGGR